MSEETVITESKKGSEEINVKCVLGGDRSGREEEEKLGEEEVLELRVEKASTWPIS